jgi:hypothetical protein
MQALNSYLFVDTSFRFQTAWRLVSRFGDEGKQAIRGCHQ